MLILEPYLTLFVILNWRKKSSRSGSRFGPESRAGLFHRLRLRVASAVGSREKSTGPKSRALFNSLTDPKLSSRSVESSPIQVTEVGSSRTCRKRLVPLRPRDFGGSHRSRQSRTCSVRSGQVPPDSRSS